MFVIYVILQSLSVVIAKQCGSRNTRFLLLQEGLVVDEAVPESVEKSISCGSCQEPVP